MRSDEVLTAETVSGRIDIDGVRAPRLEVKSFSGSVALQGVESRRVEVETVSGWVTLDGALASAGRYGIRSHSGSILLTVPEGSGFELEAESFSGDLRSDISILVGPGDPSRRATVVQRGNRAIRGTAAAAGARLTLATVSGDMVISTGAGETATIDVVPRSPRRLLSPPRPPMPPPQPPMPPPPPSPPVQKAGE